MTFHNLVDLEKLGYFLGKIKTLLNGKVDKETGKGLSTNDYTTAEKSKLEGIASGAQVNVLESVTVNGSALPVASKSVNVTIPTKMSDLTNDGDYVSDANYVHTDTNYTAAEKSKLAGIASGAQVNSITGVKGDAEESYRTGNVNITKSNVGLGNVENKSSADIRGELTKKNVTDALGYTPVESETTYSGMTEAEAKAGTATEAKLISAATLDAAIENKGYTDNTGTITGIKMNGASVGTEGVVDLGTVIKEHQDISGKLDASLKGQANGLAELDAEGKVPAAQLPSYVDDVVEYSGQSAFPATGESGKIYVDISTNKTYRWSGSAYVAVSTDIALGTTSSTAFRGDYGQAAYTHAVTNKGSAYTSGLYKITTNAEGHVTGATAVEKSDITSLGIPAQDTTYSDATTAISGLMSASDKAKLTGIDEGAQVNVLESISVNGSALNPTNKGVNVTVPTAMSDLTNDGDFVSDANYVHTDSNFTSAEKEKLAGIASGAQVNSITGVKGNSEASYRTGNVNLTKENIGLGNVENKSSETIRGELTKKNVTDALGYTPPETDTSYETMTVAEAEAGTATTGKMISAAVLDAAIENKGYTDNVGTITGITMNGVSKGTSGTVDLGAVITAHQDISGKADKTATVSDVTYDTTGKKLKKTINGTTSDVVSIADIKEDLAITKSDIGLGNVDNTSDANKPVSTAQQSALNLKVDKVTGKGLSSNDFTDALKTKLEGVEDGAEANVITGVKGEAESTYQTGNVILTKAGLGLGNVENTALSTWTGSANLTTSAQGNFGDVVTHSASDFAAASHGTHVTEQTVKSALGTGSGTTKFLREDGTWVKPENTTYESKTAASGGTAVSLVTTGEKYTWNSGIVPTGGTAGQFLKKKSSETDFDTEWDTVEVPTKVSDLTNDTGFITGMEILSYGSSTWADFLAAYTAKKVVYCRASSNANPATGSQTRLAFMAYVSNADNPTNVEFQYYRSVSSHTASQQGDQVYVYKLDKTAGWTVTTREASSKIVAGTNMSSSYSNDTLTLNATDTTYESKAAASGGTDLSLVTTGEKYNWNTRGIPASGTTGQVLKKSSATNYATRWADLNENPIINVYLDNTENPPRYYASSSDIQDVVEITDSFKLVTLNYVKGTFSGATGDGSEESFEQYHLSDVHSVTTYDEDEGTYTMKFHFVFINEEVSSSGPKIKKFELVDDAFTYDNLLDAIVTYSEISLGAPPSASGVNF